MRKKRDEGEVECVAENAHGDPVSAKASLKIFDGENNSFGLSVMTVCEKIPLKVKVTKRRVDT